MLRFTCAAASVLGLAPRSAWRGFVALLQPVQLPQREAASHTFIDDVGPSSVSTTRLCIRNLRIRMCLQRWPCVTVVWFSAEVVVATTSLHRAYGRNQLVSIGRFTRRQC